MELIQQEKRRIRISEIQQMKHRIEQLIIPFSSFSSTHSLWTGSLSSLIQSIYRHCFANHLENEELLLDLALETQMIQQLLSSCQYFITLTAVLCYFTLLTTSSTSTITTSSILSPENDYLRRYFPETSFTYLTIVLAEIYEKQRQYTTANLLYELLLLFPYIPHRRGRWYKRLAINYDHLKITNGLLSSLLRGLSDINIMVREVSTLLLCVLIDNLSCHSILMKLI